MDGFEGDKCERMQCDNDCSGHGVCRSMARHARNQWEFNTIYQYNTNWDRDMIYGCVCDEGWEGHDCSLSRCALGDDPLTTGQVDEVQFMLCEADEGWFTLTLDGVPSERIYFDDTADEVRAAMIPTMGDVDIVFQDSATQVCTDTGVVTKIKFQYRRGDVPVLTLRTDYKFNLINNGAGTTSIVIRDGETVSVDLVFNLITYTAIQGTKEWEYCSNRGKCDQTTGDCICYTGYESSNGWGIEGVRGDCGFPETPITECPGATSCSGHGVCAGHPTYRCTCDTDWMGGDCSERLCPCAASWFDAPVADNEAHQVVECSNRGKCDRVTGECACSEGFTGTACERIDCPGLATDGTKCSGHGQCMSMSQLAEVANVNGDLGGFTYGLSPHDDPRWDYNKMYGCACDVGYHGYDCSLRTCPTGDDPKTRFQDAEVQVLQCTATAGTFQLTFRQDTTEVINYDDTSDEVAAKLLELTTITGVEVTFSDGDGSGPLCLASGDNKASITFTQQFGDVPDLWVATGTADAMTPTGESELTFAFDGDDIDGITSVTGTKEDVTCSNRGVCNEATGLCECFAQYGSSDGYNNEGTRGDCGYLEPFMARTAEETQKGLEAAREAGRPSSASPLVFF